MLFADNDNERETWVLAGTVALAVVEELKKDRATEITRSEFAGGEPAGEGAPEFETATEVTAAPIRARNASPARRSAISGP